MLGRIVGNPEVLQGILQVVKRTMHASFEGLVLSGAGEKISLETASMLGKAAIEHAPAVMESASTKIAPVIESMFSQSLNMLLSFSSKDVAKLALEKAVETLQSPQIREELTEVMMMSISSYFVQKLIGEGPKGLALTGILEHKPSKAIVMAAVENLFGQAIQSASNQADQLLENIDSILPNKTNPQFTQYMIDQLAKLSKEEMATLHDEIVNNNLSEADFIERLKSFTESKVVQVAPPEIALPQEPVAMPVTKAAQAITNRQNPILSIYGNSGEKASLADILEKVPTVDVQPENDKKDKHHKPS